MAFPGPRGRGTLSIMSQQGPGRYTLKYEMIQMIDLRDVLFLLGTGVLYLRVYDVLLTRYTLLVLLVYYASTALLMYGFTV